MSPGCWCLEERSAAEARAVPGKRGLCGAQGNVRRAQGQFWPVNEVDLVSWLRVNNVNVAQSTTCRSEPTQRP